jgi:hypothetical protein
MGIILALLIGNELSRLDFLSWVSWVNFLD